MNKQQLINEIHDRLTEADFHRHLLSFDEFNEDQLELILDIMDCAEIALRDPNYISRMR